MSDRDTRNADGDVRDGEEGGDAFDVEEGSDALDRDEDDTALDSEEGDTARDGEERDDSSQVRVWMVERTYSADSPNILVIVYATPDGTRYLRKEWAFNRYGAGDAPTVTAALDVDPDRLDPVATEDCDRYANEAQRMADRHDPDDVV